MEFEIDRPGPGPSLAIYDGMDCNALCISRSTLDTQNGKRRIQLNGVQAGHIYLIQVGNYLDQTANNQLDVRWQECNLATNPDDSLEDNDTCMTAFPLGAGTYANLFVHESDPDFFSFTIPPLHQAVLSVVAPPVTVRIAQQEANCQQGTVYGVNLTLDNLGFQPEVFTFEARLIGDARCANYELQVNFIPFPCMPSSGADDPWEDNDSCQTAAVITAGTYLDLWVATEDADYYAIDLEPGEALSIPGLPGNTGMAWILFDSNCESVSNGFGFGEDGISHSNHTDEAQRFILRAEPYSITPCNAYEMVLDVQHDPCTDFGPDVLDHHAYQRNLSDGYYPALYMRTTEELSICVAAGQTLNVDIEVPSAGGSLIADLRCTNDITGCFGSGGILDTDSSQTPHLQWTNNTGIDETVLLQLQYIQGTLPCSTFNLTIAGAGSCTDFVEARDFCEPGQPNSSGLATKLFASQILVLGSPVQLECVQGPPNQFGYLLAGTDFTTPGLSIGQGLLCLDISQGSLLGRYNQGGAYNSIGQFNIDAQFENSAGTSLSGFGFTLPDSTPWGSAIAPGQSLFFQLWHRDIGGNSNLSNGVQITF
ncbi:MAG: hypothetical protein GY753_02850 [Gammaproteobacteria bacterium]|nr:hypothetical protein [Gammaproteobacteria bacterium]